MPDLPRKLEEAARAATEAMQFTSEGDSRWREEWVAALEAACECFETYEQEHGFEEPKLWPVLALVRRTAEMLRDEATGRKRISSIELSGDPRCPLQRGNGTLRL